MSARQLGACLGAALFLVRPSCWAVLNVRRHAVFWFMGRTVATSFFPFDPHVLCTR
jgi:hypothetical protein